MTPKELHEECMEACAKCNGYRHDDETYFPGFGEFGKVHKKGMYNVVLFWREYGATLWEKGYDEYLSPEAQEIFKGIDAVIKKATKKFVKKLSEGTTK